MTRRGNDGEGNDVVVARWGDFDIDAGQVEAICGGAEWRGHEGAGPNDGGGEGGLGKLLALGVNDRRTW
jgi:hypothetical protein